MKAFFLLISMNLHHHVFLLGLLRFSFLFVTQITWGNEVNEVNTYKHLMTTACINITGKPGAFNGIFATM